MASKPLCKVQWLLSECRKFLEFSAAKAHLRAAYEIVVAEGVELYSNTL